MITEEVRKTIIAELPKILRTDKKVQEVAIRLLRRQFADKKKTEDRFDRILDELAADRERQDKKWEEQNRKWEEQNKKWEEQNKKWEEQNRRWEELKIESEKKWEEQSKKWEEQDKKWFEQNRKWDEQNKKWEEQNRKWWENQKALNAMLEEIKRLSRKHDSTLGALGARWGLRSEQSFRNALAGILKETSGLEVINVVEFDDEGYVFGWPDQVELDIIIRNGLLYICEIKSSMSVSDMKDFKKKADFYQKRHNREATRLIVISPMVAPKAIDVAKRLGIVVYSYIEDIEPEILK